MVEFAIGQKGFKTHPYCISKKIRQKSLKKFERSSQFFEGF